jgi:hypothetical protein
VKQLQRGRKPADHAKVDNAAELLLDTLHHASDVSIHPKDDYFPLDCLPLAPTKDDRPILDAIHEEQLVLRGLLELLAAEVADIRSIPQNDAVADLQTDVATLRLEHSLHPIPSRTSSSCRPCRFFPRGLCRTGDICPFSHGVLDVANPEIAAPQERVRNPAPSVDDAFKHISLKTYTFRKDTCKDVDSCPRCPLHASPLPEDCDLCNRYMDAISAATIWT